MSIRRAFTLIELLVVIAIIGILASLLLVVLGKAKGRAQGSSCLSNGKQMMVALFLYTSDNHEFFPPNPDDGNTVPGYNWCPGEAGIGQPQEFDPDVLADQSRSLLIPYLAGNVSLFRCPSDLRQGVYDGTNAALIGRTVPAARTFSMSQAVGTIDPGFDAGGPHSGQRPVAEQQGKSPARVPLAHLRQDNGGCGSGAGHALGAGGRGSVRAERRRFCVRDADSGGMA
jgi:prepilin-type N-terminal cleavage/methylation domain-containing protein